MWPILWRLKINDQIESCTVLTKTVTKPTTLMDDKDKKIPLSKSTEKNSVTINISCMVQTQAMVIVSHSTLWGFLPTGH